jgi:hypothetical protein
MGLSIRSLVLVSALALPIAAHADTFAGSAVFTDSTTTNDITFTGSFQNPTFNFTGGTNFVYSDSLAITASSSQGGNGNINPMPPDDVLSILLTFTSPNGTTGTVNGSGTITGHVSAATGEIDWTPTTINFTDGSQLLASILNFNFSGADLSGDKTVTLTGPLDLTVVTDGSLKSTSPAPEPGSIALLSTGLLAAAGAVRRKLRV